jgi:hypothetical protein
MTRGPSKKCSKEAAAPLLKDETLRRWLIAHYGVHRLSHGIWTDQRGKKSERIILHFLNDSGEQDDVEGADGFIGGYCAAKGIELNPE